MNTKEPPKISTSEALKGLHEALSSSSFEQFGYYLECLICLEPNKWKQLLYLKKLIPDPGSLNFNKAIGVVMGGIGYSLEQGSEHSMDQYDLLSSLVIIHLCLKSIREKLDELNVWSEPVIETIVRLASFIEDQMVKGLQILEDRITDQRYISSLNYLTTNIPTMLGGNASILSGFEEHCELLQLIYYYSKYRYGDILYGEITAFRSPYEDVDFKKLMIYASLWSLYNDLWEKAIFMSWVRKNDPRTDISIYHPSDIEEYYRYIVGNIRFQEILSEIYSIGQLNNIGPDKKLINVLASSITIPDIGELWDCVIDNKLFKEILKNYFHIIEIELLKLYHFEQITPLIYLDSGDKKISWSTYWEVRKCLQILSDVTQLAVRQKIIKNELLTPLKRILFIHKDRLAEFISNIIGLPLQEVVYTLDILTFDPKNKQIEIWDTPLIKFSEEVILFIPCIISAGSALRAAENFVAEWNDSLFSERGRYLEKDINQFLLSVNVPVRGPITFSDVDGNKIECDLIMYWEGYLVLIEAKCTKAVFRPSDMYWARSRIIEAMEQLKFRKKAILENWGSFCKAINDIELPNTPISQENIRLVVLTNDLHFTSWTLDDIVVTDEFCLKRFFGPGDIEIYYGNEPKGSLQRIRISDEPNAKELFDYLMNPPQVKLFRDLIKVEVHEIPQVKDGDPKMARCTYSLIDNLNWHSIINNID